MAAPRASRTPRGRRHRSKFATSGARPAARIAEISSKIRISVTWATNQKTIQASTTMPMTVAVRPTSCRCVTARAPWLRHDLAGAVRPRDPAPGEAGGVRRPGPLGAAAPHGLRDESQDAGRQDDRGEPGEASRDLLVPARHLRHGHVEHQAGHRRDDDTVAREL